MDLKEIGTNTWNWVDWAQDRHYWRALLNDEQVQRMNEDYVKKKLEGLKKKKKNGKTWRFVDARSCDGTRGKMNG